MPRSLRPAACLAVLLTLVACESAWAEFRPRVGTSLAGASAGVTINGKVAVRFRVANGSLTPAQRAQLTSDRIKDLVSKGVDPRAFTVEGTRFQARVLAGDILVCVATAADARNAGRDPLGLATSWASNIKSLLLLPAVVVRPTDLTIPLGENRTVMVGGAASGPVYAKSWDDTVAAATSGTDGRYVRVSGQRVGSTCVEISVEGERVTIPVAVKKYAGYVTDASIAEVTGSPCPTSAICYAVKQALAGCVVPESGATVRLGDVNCHGGALGAGDQRKVSVDVKISGEGYITYSTPATVVVRNLVMPRNEVSQLFYSNDPERLLKYQVLFAGKLELQKATRLLYHHQNAMGKKAHLVVDLINPASTPIKVRIANASAVPIVDTVLVGYKASVDFMKDSQNNVSVIQTIPAGSRLVLVSDILGNLDTASGIIQVTQLNGEAAYMRVASEPPELDTTAAGDIASAPNPLVLSMSDHVYESPTKSVQTDYVIGQRWAFISIGKNALRGRTDEKTTLYGNYGVVYDIDVKVQNPTTETKKVQVVFDPSAGLASGVFIIDGQFVSTKYAKPPEEFSLAAYTLKPGETRNVNIKTVPVAGSNYPATLVVRS
ncbi:MAG: hypothetical protein ABFD54_02190 [Armatimonadota bacterium]|nr:hypothetical protein [bacterium]